MPSKKSPSGAPSSPSSSPSSAEGWTSKVPMEKFKAWKDAVTKDVLRVLSEAGKKPKP